jgi:hypothetical protein
MIRRVFLANIAAIASVNILKGNTNLLYNPFNKNLKAMNSEPAVVHPRAITMWDFSG